MVTFNIFSRVSTPKKQAIFFCIISSICSFSPFIKGAEANKPVQGAVKAVIHHSKEQTILFPGHTNVVRQSVLSSLLGRKNPKEGSVEFFDANNTCIHADLFKEDADNTQLMKSIRSRLTQLPVAAKAHASLYLTHLSVYDKYHNCIAKLGGQGWMDIVKESIEKHEFGLVYYNFKKQLAGKIANPEVIALEWVHQFDYSFDPSKPKSKL